MSDFDKYLDMDAPVTVCDAEGIVVAMNRRTREQFSKDGGASLIGKSLFDCHKPSSNEMIRALMREDRSNVYLVRKNGKSKIVFQTPWHEGDGDARRVAGMVEISFAVTEPLRVVERG